MIYKITLYYVNGAQKNKKIQQNGQKNVINIKAIRLDQLPEFLMSYAYRPCHGYLLENMCHGSILIYSLEKSMGFA